MLANIVRLQDLQFNVAGLLKGPTGEMRTYEVYVPVSELDQLDEGFDVTGPLQGSAHFIKTADTVLVRMRATTRLDLECARCLEPFEKELSLAVEEEFHPSIDLQTGRTLADTGDDEALVIDEHHILDLSELMRQAIILAQPIVPVCREDCEGLCPICGANRNLESCDCADTDFDTRWAALSALLVRNDDEA